MRKIIIFLLAIAISISLTYSSSAIYIYGIPNSISSDINNKEDAAVAEIMKEYQSVPDTVRDKLSQMGI